MKKALVLFLFFSINTSLSQQSDFKNSSFLKADKIAKSVKSRRLYELNKLTYNLTKDLKTDIEKVRAIYKWICLNVASDFRLYSINKRKRKKYKKDSIKLMEWNSKLKKILFKKLLRRKRTICTGYAYLFKEMCNIVDIKSKMVYGFGRTSDVDSIDFKYPNHTWNSVEINNKWYLCDATWAAGISYPEDNKFVFSYNDGYFLTEPKLFIKNHFPLNPANSLLDNPPSFNEFLEKPLLYNGAYKNLNEHVLPLKMHTKIRKNNAIAFKYLLKNNINPKKIYFSVYNGFSDKKVSLNTSVDNNYLSFSHSFKKTGLFDVHLYFDKEIIATYIVEVTQ